MIGYKTHKRMGEALLTVKVPTMERVVLLDMALAVEDGSLVYSWGHDRLALAIGKEPGTPAAKQALSGRILPRLMERGLIRKTAEAHRGRHAEYVLSVLSDPGMGNGLEPERVTVSTGMGNAQTVTPLPTPLPESTDVCNSASTRWGLTDAQRRNVLDALQAVDARCDSIDVNGFGEVELAYLDALPAEERRERIRAWSGLRSRALTDAGDDLVEDDRLHDLLFAHGYVWDAARDAGMPTWPTRVPGAPEAWKVTQEESA